MCIRDRFMKVSSILAICVIMKQQDKAILLGIKSQFMKVSSICAICVIMKLQDRTVLHGIKGLSI